MSTGGKHLYAGYSHALRQRRGLGLEKEIEKYASRYARHRDGGNADRARSAYAKLCTACFKFFYVVGEDMPVAKEGYGVDALFVELLEETARGFDPNKGLFVHYFTHVYARRVNDLGEGERRADEVGGKPIESLDVHWIDESHDARVGMEDEELGDAVLASGDSSFDGLFVDDEGVDAATPAVESFEATASGDAGDDACFDDAPPRTRDVVTLVLSKVLGFLDHKEDGRHQPQSKLYMRMVFTERVTYAVRSQPVFEACEPFERHERDTFRAAEVPFLDTFTMWEAPTRWSTRLLWSEPFKERYQKSIERLCDLMIRFETGLEELAPPKITWLDISDYQNYLSSNYGIEVTSPVISQQRDKFNRLEAEILRR